MARHPPPSARLAGRPGGSGTGGEPAAAAERLCCWTASRYIRAAAGPFLQVDSARRPRPAIPTQSRTATTRDGPLLYFGENQTGRSLLAPRQAEAPAGEASSEERHRPRAAPRSRAAARVSRRRASRQDARLRPRASRSGARDERRRARHRRDRVRGS